MSDDANKMTAAERKEFSSWKFDVMDGISFDDRLSASDRLVGFRLLQHLNHRTKLCWPSNARIAGQIGIHFDSVARSISKLEKAGWLERVRKWNPKVGATRCEYTINPPDSMVLDLRDQAEMRVEEAHQKSNLRAIAKAELREENRKKAQAQTGKCPDPDVRTVAGCPDNLVGGCPDKTTQKRPDATVSITPSSQNYLQETLSVGGSEGGVLDSETESNDYQKAKDGTYG